MTKLTPRQIRFVKIWLVEFAIITGYVVTAISLVGGIIWGITYIGRQYGADYAFLVVFVLSIIGFIVWVSYVTAKKELSEREKEDDKILAALGRDNSDSFNEYVPAWKTSKSQYNQYGQFKSSGLYGKGKK